ncbi:MAG: DUF2812 domain-containing protein [Lawsonibacter sp.]
MAVFEKGEPKAVRYRLEPAPVKESCPDPERLAAYRSMGWEYVDTSGKSMHLWRCDDPGCAGTPHGPGDRGPGI